MTTMRKFLLLLVSGAGFALVGCGGDGSPAATPTTPAPAAPPADLRPAFPSGGDSVPDQVFIEGVEITPLTLPAAAGGDGTLSYELTPALPEGLSLDSDTRVISGDPNGVSEEQAYSWTATDADGDAAVIQFSITVEDDVAPVFRSGSGRIPDSERIPDQVWVLDDPIAPLTMPEAVGGNGEISYRVQPPLPDGIRLNGRVLSGTPTGTEHWGGTKRRYAWVATDSNGDTASMDFELGLEGGVLFIDGEIQMSSSCATGSPECIWTWRIDRWRISDVRVEIYAIRGSSILEVNQFISGNERLAELLRRKSPPVLAREHLELSHEILTSRFQVEYVTQVSRDHLDAGERWPVNVNAEFLSVIEDYWSVGAIYSRLIWGERVFVGGETAGSSSVSDMMWKDGGLQKILVSPGTRRHD